MMIQFVSLFLLLRAIALVTSDTPECAHDDVHIDLSSKSVNWYLCNQQSLVELGIASGSVVSRPSFQFDHHAAFDQACFPARAVPGTAMINMAMHDNGFNGINADNIFIGDNLRRVPDIADAGKEYYTYYWMTSFNLTEVLSPSPSSEYQYVACEKRLVLRSINYRATVYINGEEVPPENLIEGERAAVGMFHRWSYILPNNSPLITIAILVEPPDYPGRATGDQGGDHDIARNAAIQQSVAGWDWIRGTPDRNTGLWDKVFLELRDSTLSIQNIRVHIISEVASRHPDYVDVQISFDLKVNYELIAAACMEAEECDSPIEIVASVPPQKLAFSISLEKSTQRIKSTLRLIKPRTWWPHNYGEPYLYALTLQAYTCCSSKRVLHSKQSVKFGVRSFTSYVDQSTDGRVFLCNGERMFLQGGNWITTDQFLRFSTSKARYQNEVRLHKAMGLNTIRVWGGGILERPELYEMSDEAGILIMQEFWMTGDNNGRWAGSFSSPENHHVYLACAKDSILMLRNHASLLMWVGGNELHPAKLSPPSDIQAGLEALINDLDSKRFYISSSMGNYTDYVPRKALAPKDGPYGYLSYPQFYQRNPGLRFWNGTRADELKIGFQPEIGSSASLSYREMNLIFRSTDKGTDTSKHIQFPSKNDVSVPALFEYHNYQSFTDDRGHDHIRTFGLPGNLSEYCLFAQMAQYMQSKILYEGFQRYMWTYYSAVIYWKTQSPWPSLRGYMYSWWLEQTGGFYGVLHALEGGQPLHVQLGNWSRDTSIVVVNRSPHMYNDANFSLQCEWYDIDGMALLSKKYFIDGSLLLPHSVYRVEAKGINFPNASPTGIVYLRLVLSCSQRSSVCRRGKYNRLYTSPYGCSFNDYTLSDPNFDQNLTMLGSRRQNSSALLDLDVSCQKVSSTKIMIVISNPTDHVALQVRARVDSLTRKYIYSGRGQYYTLLPRETQQVYAEAMAGLKKPASKDLPLLVDGLNVFSRKVKCRGNGGNGRIEQLQSATSTSIT